MSEGEEEQQENNKELGALMQALDTEKKLSE